MSPSPAVVKLTNCRLAIGDDLVWRDLYVSGTTGRILDPQHTFFNLHTTPSETKDLNGRIIAPGFIDVQINGGFGFDFSVPDSHYGDKLKAVERKLIRTGVTSYVPTLTSQKAEVYGKTLPFLAARSTRSANDGTESLGAHCEGPFLNPEKNGIHKKEVLQKPTSLASLEACYGKPHLDPTQASKPPSIKMITMAPELDTSQTVIKELKSRGITVSMGHSAATYEQASEGVRQGATMITHLFNAMNQPHHRTSGIFGILGSKEDFDRPFYGIIADDIHVHPSMVKVAYTAHPDGCILVTDAMSVLGLPDGDYEWTNGEMIEKRGIKVTLKGTDGTIAGSCVTLLECLNNLLYWTGVPVATAIKTVTSTPAKMLGLENEKGNLLPGADADFVVLVESRDSHGRGLLLLDEVWKFGTRVYSHELEASEPTRSKL